MAPKDKIKSSAANIMNTTSTTTTTTITLPTQHTTGRFSLSAPNSTKNHTSGSGVSYSSTTSMSRHHQQQHLYQHKVEQSDDFSIDDKRSAHNALERQRREGLNSKFQQLAHALPGLQNVRRPSKSMIVAKSLEFVTKSSQRDTSYQNKIRQLRKEHDTLRRHTQRSQQHLRKRMMSDDPLSFAKTNQPTAAALPAPSSASPSTKRHKTHPSSKCVTSPKSSSSQSSSSLLASANMTKKNTTLHKFVHHHVTTSVENEPKSISTSLTPSPVKARPVLPPSSSPSSSSSAHQRKSSSSSSTISSSSSSLNHGLLMTENSDTPITSTFSPQQQQQNVPAMESSPPVHAFPVYRSWPPLDLSALQPPPPPLQATTLAQHHPADTYTSDAHIFSHSMTMSANDSNMTAAITTMPNMQATVAIGATMLSSPSHLSTYMMSTGYPSVYPHHTTSASDTTLSYFWK